MNAMCVRTADFVAKRKTRHRSDIEDHTTIKNRYCGTFRKDNFGKKFIVYR